MIKLGKVSTETKGEKIAPPAELNGIINVFPY